jgi:hypothetical protein
MWRMPKMQEQFLTKEKYPKETPPEFRLFLRFSLLTTACFAKSCDARGGITGLKHPYILKLIGVKIT